MAGPKGGLQVGLQELLANNTIWSKALRSGPAANTISKPSNY